MSSRSVGAARGWETRRQNDERVTVNLPPDFLPLWSRIKTQFRGSAQEREEAFLKYAYEHAGEVEHAIDLEAEATLAGEIARFERQPAPSDDDPAFEADDAPADPSEEMRAWVADNVPMLAEAHGVDVEDIQASLVMWETLRVDRMARVQAEAHRSRLTAQWGPEGARVDLSFLGEGPPPSGGLVVVGPGWYVSVPLRELARHVRMHPGAHVSAGPSGLEVSWVDAHGGGRVQLPSSPVSSHAVYLHLPPAPFACAA